MYKRRRKQQISILYKCLFILLVIAISILFSLQIFFNIKTINVAGLTKYEMSEIIATSGLKLGENIFKIDKEKIETKIYEEYPYFTNVEVKVLLPNSVDIIVTETKDSYIVLDNENTYTLLGENRRVIKTEEGTYVGDLPKFVGLDLSALPKGYEISQRHLSIVEVMFEDEEDTEKSAELRNEIYSLIKLNNIMDMMERVCKATKENEIDRICYYDISDGMSVTFLYDYNIIVKMGSELYFDYKLRFLKEVLDKLETNFKGTINMESFSVNKKAYTREEPITDKIHSSFMKRYY